jgi:hypothetical protein
MPRANLSALLGNVEPGPEPRPAASSKPPVGGAAAPAAAPPSQPKTRRSAPVRNDARPLYLRMVRKEARLRERQYEALTQHARRLSRARGGQGPRITENTLIRIAVDLLLDRIEAASGVDEAALLESIRRPASGQGGRS